MTEIPAPVIKVSLVRFYVRLAAPAAALMAGLYVLRKVGALPLESPALARAGGPAVFIVSAVMALAAPIFHRGLFAHRVRGEKALSSSQYLSYQKTQITLALIAPYTAAAGLIMDITQFHLVGAFFFALYGLYYYYPFTGRIRRETRAFRVKPSTGEA